MNFNCYVSAVAPDEAEARSIVEETFHDKALDLVHTEPGTDDEESPTWVFKFWAESFADEETMDRLHDMYTGLDHLPNLPYEAA